MEFVLLAGAVGACVALLYQLYRRRAPWYSYLSGLGLSLVFAFCYLLGGIWFVALAGAISNGVGLIVMLAIVLAVWCGFARKSKSFLGGIFLGLATVEVTFILACVLMGLKVAATTYPVAVLLAGMSVFAAWFIWRSRSVDAKGFAVGGTVVFCCAVLPALIASLVFCCVCQSSLTPASQREIGDCYEELLPIPLEAVRWYRKAAVRGDAHACYRLGRCYAAGRGVRLDRAEARRWLEIAADHGSRDAAELLKERRKENCK